MSGRFLLDTNVVVGLLTGDEVIRQHLTQDAKVFLPAVVVGELYYGARKSHRAEENLARINQFAFSTVVLDCDIETANEYSMVKNELRLKGRPIPENDLWVAAIARQHNLVLVSQDKHFVDIERISLEQWQ